MQDHVGLDARLAHLALAHVLLRVVDRVLQHALDLGLAEAVGRLHLDRALVPGAEVGGGDGEDAVGVDQEGDLDPRHAGGQRADRDLEAGEAPVVAGQLPLALQDVDVDRRLVVDRGGEGLLDAGRDGGVAVHEPREDPAHGLDAERERHHVEEEHVAPPAGEDAGLDAGAERHHPIGVDVGERRAAEDGLHLAAHEGDARRAANGDDAPDVLGPEPGVLERLAAGAGGALDEILHQRLELRPRDRTARGAEHDLRPLGVAERPLDVLRRRPRPGAHVGAAPLRLGQLGQHELGQALVEVVAPEVRVAARRQHLEHPGTEAQDGDVEGAAAQVVDRDHAFVLLVEAVGERGRGGLVHQTQHLEAGEPPGIARRLALAVVEVGRHGDDRLADRLAERRLGPALELAQDVGRDLRRRHLAALDHQAHDAPAAGEAVAPAILGADVLEAEAHEALDGEDGVERPLAGERLGARADDHLAAGQEGDRRGQQRRPRLRVGQHPRPALLEHGDEAVRRAEINADDPSHGVLLPSRLRCRRAACAGRRSRRAGA